jgi:uncharacterized nucleotidyltransferase DUF6036
MKVTGPGQPVQLLVDIIDVLSALQVPYAVVGALAVSFHGVPRSTNDADAVIWLERPGKTETILTRHLMDSGYQIQFRPGDIDDPVTGVEDEHQNRVDLLLGIRGLAPDARERSIVAKIQDIPVRFISAEDLVAMKVFAGGLQDLEDVKGILRVSKETLDFGLLKSLVSRYGVETTTRLVQILKSVDEGS